MDDRQKKRRNIQEKGRWRKLDNSAKLFAAVAGEELTNVFRISAELKKTVQPGPLWRALSETLEEFGSFRVKLRRGFFWNYLEVNNREPLVEEENSYPCKYIDPHRNHLYLFRVSYYKKRINFEVFHALTDGMGAVNFMKKMTERYLFLTLEEPAGRPEERISREERLGEDGYLKYYRKLGHKRRGAERAMELKGERLPLDCQSVVHGFLDLKAMKGVCRESGVSITKYLTALLIWSLIKVYGGDGPLPRPVGVNLPINLRSFFDSETMANFFAVTNIIWPAGRQPEKFEEVLLETGRQMDENISRDKLEETISCNVASEKKWYVRIAPLFIKNIVTGLIFARSSKAYTMTLSNLGLVRLDEKLSGMVENFTLIMGVSKKQKMKCAVIAYEDKLCVSFNSALSDTRLSDYFFGFLREKGVPVALESNGAVDREHDAGKYPEIFYNRGRIKKLVNVFYLTLFAAALVTWLVNLATYDLTGNWWSVIAIGGIVYAAMTVRYSIMRRASVAGILVIESLGAQALLVLIDYMTGFGRWSFNFAIPSVIQFDVISAVFLMIVNRRNWQIYLIYQLAVTVFSFIPLIFVAAGLATQPFMSIITAALSVSVMVVTFVLGARNVKDELRRRFHL